MLVVGLFAVLSWDSMFPDRRDVLVLAPLPVRGRTLFLAKVAAVATALSLTVAALHSFAGLVWPDAAAEHSGVVIGVMRSFAAYSITMLSAGAFVLCSLLCVQGLAALLPRRLFLRISAILQIAAFCLLLCVYFLEPMRVTPDAVTAPQNQQTLAWLPTYWFLGLFQTLNGTAHPALTPLAWRAAAGLAIAVVGSGVAFLLSYLRTLRKIIEEPDITPVARGGRWLPPFGDPPLTAVVHSYSDAAPEPSAPFDPFFLLGTCVHHRHPLRENAPGPEEPHEHAGHRPVAPGERTAAGFEHRDDVVRGDRNAVDLRCLRSCGPTGFSASPTFSECRAA